MPAGMVRSHLTAALALTLVCVVTGTATRAEAAGCSSHATQAEAQRAADTRDADGDGRYCESLPCPCAAPPAPVTPPPACLRPAGVQSISFSGTRYAAVRRHYERALARGWPAVLVLNRAGAIERRERLMRGRSTREGYDRDEYPPAVGRGAGRPALMQGAKPRGWKASVQLVPAAENRGHGSTLGIKLRRFCDGTLFRYVFY